MTRRRSLTVGEISPPPEDALRALTVLQPFASAICSLGPHAKRVENRGWPRVYPKGGLWVAIHAGAAYYPIPPGFRRGPDGWVAFLDDLGRRTGWPALRASLYKRGAILGLARFVDCVPVASRAGDPWAVGPWCHVIAEVRVLPTPIVGVKGALGFWRVPDEHLPALRALLA